MKKWMYLSLLLGTGIIAASCGTKEKPSIEENTTVVETDSLIPGTDTVAVTVDSTVVVDTVK